MGAVGAVGAVGTVGAVRSVRSMGTMRAVGAVGGMGTMLAQYFAISSAAIHTRHDQVICQVIRLFLGDSLFFRGEKGTSTLFDGRQPAIIILRVAHSPSLLPVERHQPGSRGTLNDTLH